MTHKISDIQIIIQHRLKSFLRHILIHGFKAAFIIDFKLLIALCTFGLLAGVFAFMVTDACRNTCGNLRCGNFYDTVTEGFAFSGGYRNADKGHENTIGTKNLTKLLLTDIQRVDFIIIDNRAQSGTG